MRELRIAGRLINDTESAYVIAEIGSNHQGDIHIAHRMIDAAAQADVQAVKLQKRNLDTFLTPEEYLAPYENENSYGATYGEHREHLELSIEQHRELMDHAHRMGLAYGCTAFDVESAGWLCGLPVDFLKIASGSICNDELLHAIRYTTIPKVASTGGATMDDVDGLVSIIDSPLAILHCTSLYPCPSEKLNLKAIRDLYYAFPLTVIGFSDHQDGIDLAAVAYMCGARIFEKHFTLDRSAKGTDHAMSLEPVGMAAYVRTLRRIPEALGNGVKRLLPEEIPALRKQGRRFE